MPRLSASIFWALAFFNLLGCSVAEVDRSQAAAVNSSQVTAVKATDSTQLRQPNILLIVADDLGYADISTYGGEIPTPNVDSLANRGITFTRFYASMTCSPTRAMLMTGTDNHIAGLGNMAETIADNQVELPGYEGHLNDGVVTVAELLRDAGYHTYMAGKWHLGLEHEQSARARGFERSFALLYGGGSHFDDMVGPEIHRARLLYREDGELIDKLPENFYSTHFYTDRILENIDSQLGDNKPFFAYLAYTSPHWPLQAPDDIIDKYRGKYDDGYDVIRAQRFQRMKKVGLLPPNAELPPRPEFIPPWDSLAVEEKQKHARNMEVYAAMVDDLDANIGRVIQHLKAKGVYENTVILFMSDNGADGLQLGKIPAFAQHIANFDNSFDNIGRRNSFSFYGPEWAHVSEAPFRLYKGVTTEGGIRVPAVISYPGANTRGVKNDSLVSVMDVLPTALELAGERHPGETYKGRKVHPPKGRSLLPILMGQANRIRNGDDSLGVEMWGKRAIIKGEWKLLNLPQPKGSGEWELFNLSEDPGEQYNLAKSEPDKLAEMISAWDQYAAENNVTLPDGPFRIHEPTGQPTR